MRFDASLRPGLAFMTLHFPDQVATNVLTIDATDPKSGTAEFKASAIRIDKLAAGAPAVVDIRTTGGPPTAEEIAAVDGFLGDAGIAVGGRRAPPRRRSPRVRGARGALATSPAAAGAARDAGPRRLGQPRRASSTRAGASRSRRPTLTGSRASTRASRSRSGRRSRSTCATTSPANAPARTSCARRSRRIRSAGARRGTAAWYRSPCLGSVRSRARGPGRARRRDATPSTQIAPVTARRCAGMLRGGAWPAPRAHADAPMRARGRGRLLRRVGVVDPDEHRQLSRGTAATRRCGARWSSVRKASSAR